jgi:hypothetical protein
MPQPQMRQGGVHTVSVFGDGTGDDMVFVGDSDIPDDATADGGGGMVIIRTVEVPGHGGGDGSQPAQKPAKNPD